jgi:hypothetical protein
MAEGLKNIISQDSEKPCHLRDNQVALEERGIITTISSSCKKQTRGRQQKPESRATGYEKIHELESEN